MSFAKLDSGIVNSTIWVQPHDVLRVWIWFLSQCDARGVIRAAAPAISLACMVPVERMREILHLLESPDEDSRTPDHDGRRIERIEGGWRILNYGKYRESREPDERREYQREWDRQHRPSGHARKVRPQSDHSPTKSDQPRPETTEAEAEVEEERAKATSKAFAPSDARTTPAAISLPLNDGTEYPITEGQVREFADLYPAVDVPQALRAMRGWCVTNPTNRKTRSGVLRFVNRWLAKEQDSARPANGGSHANSSSGGRISAAERVARVNAEAERRGRAAAEDAIDGEYRLVR